MPLLREVLSILRQRDRSTSLVHIYREANRNADFLANKGHFANFEWTLVNSVPPLLRIILAYDVKGSSLPRLIS